MFRVQSSRAVDVYRLPPLMKLAARWMSKSHYQVLGVASTASAEDVRAAFLDLSKKYHPDVNKGPNSHAKFVEVSKAYSVLGNSASRRKYDASLGDFSRSSRPSDYPEGHPMRFWSDAQKENNARYNQYREAFYEYERRQRVSRHHQNRWQGVLFCVGIIMLGATIQMQLALMRTRKYAEAAEMQQLEAERRAEFSPDPRGAKLGLIHNMHETQTANRLQQQLQFRESG